MVTPKRINPQTNLQYWVDKKEKPGKYSQDWHNYNLAQTSEKLLFMDFLNDLCQYVDNPKNKGRGRPQLKHSEMVYCMAMCVYNGKSGRRNMAELYYSKDKRFINHIPHFNSVFNYYNRKDLHKQLQKLITLSSLPLGIIEKDFAIDSSGFTTSIFGRWFDHKWGEKKKRRIWRKAHVMSGVRTNVITAVKVTKGSSADAKELAELVKNTRNNFDIREVSGDLAYSSRKNLEVVSQHGAIPFIPFKKNAGSKQRGCMIWKQMYLYFQEHYDEYMDHYHKRSNAETIFSMIKKKLGMNLRTKTETAQTNEILCKVLCHNIIVLIHELFELGIDIDFYKLAQKMNFYAEDNHAQIIPQKA